MEMAPSYVYTYTYVHTVDNHLQAVKAVAPGGDVSDYVLGGKGIICGAKNMGKRYVLPWRPDRQPEYGLIPLPAHPNPVGRFRLRRA